MIDCKFTSENWPIAGAFTIARGSKTEAKVVVVTLTDGDHSGHGEAVPYGRYSETIEGSLEALEAVRAEVERGISRVQLQSLMPPGAARNALDCALWDLEAKRSGTPAYVTAGLKTLSPLKTAYTLSLASPEVMGEQAAKHARRPLLKLKLGGGNDLARVEAVRANAPKTRLIVDGNESLSLDELKAIAPELKRLGVVLIEQPLPSASDDALLGYDCPVALCADESLHDRAGLARIARLYSHINIKLDKTGGLTEALELKREAQSLGLGIMVGCMVATSLSMAPAMLIAQGAEFVDLDGPLLLAKDREFGLEVTGSILTPPDPKLWG